MINSELCDITLNNIDIGVKNNSLSNSDLIQIIELCGSYLNIETISNAAKLRKKTYNGIKKTKNIVNIFGVKFVIDND